jgi:hypothetical protein
MSMTKRMMESRGDLRTQVSPERRAMDAAQRNTNIASVFEISRPYHHAFVKSRLRKKRMDVYRLLYPNGRPSTTTFYDDLKQAGSVPAYLTHYFYCNIKKCLEALGLPPAAVDELLNKTSTARQYVLSLEDAVNHAPGEDEITNAQGIQPKPRHFRHNCRVMPSVMYDRSIQEFFTGIYAKNELFYQAHPSALFKAELLDYQDYLQSPFWFVIRNIVLFRDSFKCRVCSAKATTVHHISYDADVLYGKDIEPLVSLCEPCHTRIEFDDAGGKITDLAVKKERYETFRRNAASEGAEQMRVATPKEDC